MVFDVKGKVALITGGAAGIGRSYAKELLRNGVKGVAIADTDVKKGEEAAHQITAEFGDNKVVFIRTDVTKADQLEAAFRATLTTFKALDIVINNAGILNDSQWELEIAINCNHVVRGSLLAMEFMGKNKGGRGGVVVNIASILGLQPLSGCPIYTATKHFVIGLSRSFGTSLYDNLTGVKFLTMCPGVTDTPLIAEAGRFAVTGISDKIGMELVEEIASLPAQPTENVARGLMTMLAKGDNGSVWVSEGGQPVYEVQIPERQTLRKQ